MTPITFTCCEKRTKKKIIFQVILHVLDNYDCLKIHFYFIFMDDPLVHPSNDTYLFSSNMCQLYNFKSKIPVACQCQLRIDESLMLLLGNIVPHTYNDRTKKIQIYSFFKPTKREFQSIIFQFSSMNVSISCLIENS